MCRAFQVLAGSDGSSGGSSSGSLSVDCVCRLVGCVASCVCVLPIRWLGRWGSRQVVARAASQCSPCVCLFFRV